MKIKQLFLILIIFSLNSRILAQNENTSMKKLVSILNEKIAPTVQFTVVNDSGFVSILNTKQIISLRRSIKNSPFFKSQNNNKKGPYIGPIYWIYDIEKITSKLANFKEDSIGMLLLDIEFGTPDTIVINARKNAYSSYHRPIDVEPHEVVWKGQKSLLLHLKIINEIDEFQLEVNRVDIKGILRRTDQFDLARNFSNDLGNAFKLEFLKVFKNPEFVIQLNQILPIDP